MVNNVSWEGRGRRWMQSSPSAEDDREIARFLAAEGWGLSPRAVRKLMRRIRKERGPDWILTMERCAGFPICNHVPPTADTWHVHRERRGGGSPRPAARPSTGVEGAAAGRLAGDNAAPETLVDPPGDVVDLGATVVRTSDAAVVTGHHDERHLSGRATGRDSTALAASASLLAGQPTAQPRKPAPERRPASSRVSIPSVLAALPDRLRSATRTRRRALDQSAAPTASGEGAE